MEEEGGSCPRRATMRGERERESHLITAGLEHAVRVPSRRRQPRPARCSRHQRPKPREVRPRGGTSAREETRKDCRRSASPPSNCYSRRALSPSPLSFNRRHLCWESPSLLNEEGEFESASEGRKKESRWRSRSPSSRLLLPSTELVIRGASPMSLLMNRLRPCCDLAQPYTPSFLSLNQHNFSPVLTPCMKLAIMEQWELLML
ncbi:uncharacterized protein LOC130941310 [Arachis stenosperma]|uniref:uncharacterized protein LOC130941310 n=1 Tax=Arachis stenosperma TaxID=217475 RepID=UPI0025AC915A|nr:uncharacterized protein LOC130941310 [Arachis stenosperma]